MSTWQETNLLPGSIAGARVWRRRLRMWVAIGAVTAGVLISVDVGLRAAVHGPESSHQAAYARLVNRDEVLKAQLVDHARAIEDVRRRTELTARVTTRPDWSLLLAALAAERGDGVSLTSCAVDEIDKGDGVWVTIGGLSLAQADVQAFVIALEQTGLFDEVVLLDTRRAMSGGSERLSFNVAAAITGERASRADAADDGSVGP